MTFFNLAMTEPDAKQRFQELSKTYHSDKTGDDVTSNKIYSLIREEYDEFRAIRKHWNEIVSVVMRNKTAWLNTGLNVVRENQDVIFDAGKQIWDYIKKNKAVEAKDM